MGTTVDSNGFTSLPLGVGATRYYVSNSGNDTNAGTNPAAPLLTVAAAVAKIVAGRGDQVLLAEGSTFAEGIGNLDGKNGFSAAYPTVLSSYDPADPTNDAKIGMGHQRNARPILTGMSGGGIMTYFAMKGIEWNPPNVANQSLGFSGLASHYLIENCLIYNMGLSWDRGTGPGYPVTAAPVIFRNNVITGNGGMYFSGLTGLVIEDNIFWHNAWKVGASRDDSPSIGGPNGFVHPFYIQSDNVSTTVRRNLVMDGGADAGHMRGNGIATQNLFIDNPYVLSIGGDGNSVSMQQDRFNGVLVEVSYNAALGAVNTSSTVQAGGGIDATNGKPGTRVHHNLLARGVPASVNAFGFKNLVYPGVYNRQSAYAQFDRNVMYGWVTNLTGAYSQGQSDANGAYAHTAYDANTWDGPATGTNVNATTSGSFTNPYTAATFYAALTATYPSITDKTSFINYVIAHPEAHVQRLGLQLLLAGYGIAQPTDVTAPILTSATATATGNNAATIGATTNEGAGVLWGALIPPPAISASAAPVLNTPTQTTGGNHAAMPCYYNVSAILADGETALSNEVSIVVSAASGAAVNLSWSSVTGATGYRLYKSNVSGDENMGFKVPGTSFLDVGVVPSSATPAGAIGTAPTLNTPTTSTTGGGLQAGTYYYKIAVTDSSSAPDSGDSPASNEVSITTTGSSSKVTLTWPALGGATGYRVFRGTSAGGENVFFDVGNNLTFIDTGVGIESIAPPGTPYPDQVKFGLDRSGVAWNAFPSLVVTSTGAQTISASTVTPGTYDAYLMQEDASGNKSNVVNSTSITVAGQPFATLSSTDKTSNISLDATNLIATTSGSSIEGIRASRAVTAGAKIYWESHVEVSADNNAPGLANASATLGGTLWKVATPNAAQWWGGAVYYNGASTGTGAASGASGWDRHAYDDTAKKYWVGNSTGWLNGDPVAGTGGLSVSGIGTPIPGWQGDSGDKVRFNFGATAYQYTAPSGYGNL